VLSEDRECLGVHTEHTDLLINPQPAIYLPEDCIKPNLCTESDLI
jgi:hypothetical protein